MLKQYLQKFFANKFYPTTKRDWYAEKGYVGNNDQEKFINFLQNQQFEGEKFHTEFQSVNLSRQFISSTEDTVLDSVMISPNKFNNKTIVNKNLYFIFFQGRGEYYESRFRDMAIQAYKTGANVIGFNPKGFCSSTGNTQKLSDIVEDGIAVIKYLMDTYKLNSNQIILQGNSLGGGVQEMVSEYFRKNYNYHFRQINSNSFKNLSAVIACSYKIPFLEYIIKPILLYAGWEIITNRNFYSTGIYRCVLRRLNDRTILKEAEFFHMINIENDNKNCPNEYCKINKWLYENCQLTLDDDEIDPHLPSLNHFYFTYKDYRYSVYELINIYINESNKYV
ncbi:MAG: hypothetical protein EKK61_04845 [Rickettsiales bacterium]|nr:MAG: hypothetical protein EKK61_04845 [Rickettsiales bacterium]